jgi:hypothetical protein
MFSYPTVIRRAIYSTKAIEGYIATRAMLNMEGIEDLPYRTLNRLISSFATVSNFMDLSGYY